MKAAKLALATAPFDDEEWEAVDNAFPGVKDWLLARDIDPNTVREFGIRSDYRGSWEVKVSTSVLVHDGKRHSTYTFPIPT